MTCMLKEQTLHLRGGIKLIVKSTSIDVVDGLVTHRLHLSPAGDVLTVTQPLTSEGQKAMG